jgi:hypothetical protein
MNMHKGLNIPSRNGQDVPSSAQSTRAFGRSVLAGVASTLSARPLWSEAPVRTLKLQFATNRQIPVDYVGLSYETIQLADPSFFAADNQELVALFRALCPQGVLGAGRFDVLRLVLGEGMALAGCGLVLGLGGAWLVGRAMQSMLYGVTSFDYAAFGAVGAVLLASAVMACYVPAHQAAAVDPVIALRQE